MSSVRTWLAENSPEEIEHFLGEVTRLRLESGRVNKLCSSLSDYDFIEAKINHPKFGVRSLIEDYELIENAELSDRPEYNSETLEDLKLIKQALQLSAHILDRDTKQLAGQLTGRLLLFKKQTKIQQLLQKISQTEIQCLLPLTPSLTPPGNGLIGTLTGHTDSVNAIAISHDDQYVVSGSNDKTIKVWDIATGQEIRTLSGHTDSVNAIAISHDDQYVVSVSSDKTIKVWLLATGEEIRTLSGYSYWVFTIAISHDDTCVFSASDYTVEVWLLATGEEICTLSDHIDRVNGIAISRVEDIAISHEDDKYVVSGFRDNTIKVCSIIAPGEEICTLSGHTDSVDAIAISHDDQYVVSGSRDNTIKVWDIATGEEICTLSGHSDWVLAIAISHKDRYVVSGSKDNTIKIWSLATGEEIRTLSGHSDSVFAIAISHDDRYVVSGSNDNTIKVWSLAIGEEIRTLSGHSDSVNAIAISH